MAVPSLWGLCGLKDVHDSLGTEAEQTMPRDETDICKRCCSLSVNVATFLMHSKQCCVKYSTSFLDLCAAISDIKRLCIPHRTLWRYTNVVLLLLLLLYSTIGCCNSVVAFFI